MGSANVPPDQLSKSLLNGIQGISPIIADQLTTGAADIAEEDYRYDDFEKTAEIVYENLSQLKMDLHNPSILPRVYVNGEAPVDFHAIALQALEGIYPSIDFKQHICSSRIFLRK